MTEGRIEKQKNCVFLQGPLRVLIPVYNMCTKCQPLSTKKKDKQKQYQSVKLHGIKTLDDE